MNSAKLESTCTILYIHLICVFMSIFFTDPTPMSTTNFLILFNSYWFSTTSLAPLSSSKNLLFEYHIYNQACICSQSSYSLYILAKYKLYLIQLSSHKFNSQSHTNFQKSDSDSSSPSHTIFNQWLLILSQCIYISILY